MNINLKRTSKVDFYFSWLEDDKVFQEIDHFLGVEYRQGVDWELYDPRWPCTLHVTHLVFFDVVLAEAFAKKFNRPDAGYHEDYEQSPWTHSIG
jgi:hypothetical protein